MTLSNKERKTLNAFAARIAKAKLAPGETEKVIAFGPDLPTFALRIRPPKARSWVVRYRIPDTTEPGKTIQRRKTMSVAGSPGETGYTLEEAYLEARSLLLIAGKGLDPERLRIKAEEVAAQAVNQSIGTLVDKYLAAKSADLRSRSHTELTRHMKKTSWKPLHDDLIDDLPRQKIAARLEEIRTASGVGAADHARTHFHAFFTWAMGQGHSKRDGNPVSAIPRFKTLKESRRDHYLDDDEHPGEIAAVWNACRDDAYGRIVRLLLLTGQRREEVAGMVWSEIDLDEAVWTLPSTRTKNSLRHRVPLCDQALTILHAVRNQRSNRDLLFGNGVGPFSGWSKAKASLDKRIAAAHADRKAIAVRPWVLHDLRRTFSTHLNELGVEPHIVEACLNHSTARKGAELNYNKATYFAARRKAHVLWGEHVAGLVGDSPKVIALPRAG